MRPSRLARRTLARAPPAWRLAAVAPPPQPTPMRSDTRVQSGKRSRKVRRLPLEILPQPDGTACGPTCLHAVYRYYGDKVNLGEIVREVARVPGGGTLAVLLACHALRRGYAATIYTYNLQVFDPTWFGEKAPPIAERLKARREAKKDDALSAGIGAYLEFLERGGELLFQDLTAALIRRYLNRSIPILTGLSATYLYRCSRELAPSFDADDVRGDPAGHFVVLCGYDKRERTVLVADPLLPNPMGLKSPYSVEIARVNCAILLGILTSDANLLIIEPRERR